MRRTISDKRKKNGHALACPHCRAGVDGVTAGLYWGFQDHCWQCIICGYRAYEQVLRLRNEAEIAAEKIWDEIFDDLDDEKSGQTAHHY
jgi:hypothetical protein